MEYALFAFLFGISVGVVGAVLAALSNWNISGAVECIYKGLAATVVSRILITVVSLVGVISGILMLIDKHVGPLNPDLMSVARVTAISVMCLALPYLLLVMANGYLRSAARLAMRVTDFKPYPSQTLTDRVRIAARQVRIAAREKNVPVRDLPVSKQELDDVMGLPGPRTCTGPDDVKHKRQIEQVN